MQESVPFDYFSVLQVYKVWSEGSVTNNFGVRDLKTVIDLTVFVICILIC